MKSVSRLLLLGLFALVANVSYGQSNFGIGLSGSVLLPVSGEFDGSNAELSDVVKTGFGGTIHFRYFATDDLRLSLNVGLAGHELEADDEAVLEFVPITLSADYAFGTSSIRPYVGAEAGVFLTRTRDFRNPITLRRDDTDAEAYFGVAPIIGVRAPITDKLDVDLNAKYLFIFVDDNDATNQVTAGIIPISIGLNYRF